MFTSTAAEGTLTLEMSEDAWMGNAQFTVTVDGNQVGGVQTVTELHGTGLSQEISLSGKFDTSSHDVGINFINDAWGGTSATDRNLYVKSITMDGMTTTENTVQGQDGTHHYAIAGTDANNLLVLNVSEDAWMGNAQFTVMVDGRQVGGVQTVTASHGAGQSQDIALVGDFNGTSGHADVAINFLNDAWGGTAATDRNLHVEAITLNGVKTIENTVQGYGGAQDYVVPSTIENAVTPVRVALGGSLDISNLLDGFHPGTSAMSDSIADFVTAKVSGSNTAIFVDRDGSGTAFHSQEIGVLTHVSDSNINDLINQHHVIINQHQLF